MKKQSIQTNERELVGKLAEWFNETIKRNKLPFKEATIEVTARSESKNYFGDLVLWIDRESQQAYSYIEIKPPFAAKENLERLKKKAIIYKVKYCYTWDFQNFNAYEIKSYKLNLHNTESTPIMVNLTDWLRGDIQAIIKKYILIICDEIVNHNETGKFRKFLPDKIFFVKYIRDVVERLVPLFESHYSEIARNKNKRSRIISYGKEQGIAYNNPTDYYRLIARQGVYNIVTKLIFYLTVRRYFTDLPDLNIAEKSDLENYMKIAFLKAQEKDWQAVFEESEIETFGIPKTSYDILLDFFTEMKIYHFGELPEDVIGELFEEIIDPEKRHSLGQYFTNENLVDFILGFVVNSEEGFYVDTTCGSGTFLIRIYDRLKYLSRKLSHFELLEKIWGFDIAKFPAELATINLFKQEISNFQNFPRIRRSDIFLINRGDTFEFPPPTSNKNYNKISIRIPEFHAIVGNFPFIRQELIEKEEKGYKLYLTKVLAKDYFLTYPKLFHIKNINEGTIEHLDKLSSVEYIKEIERYVENGSIQLKLSGQADIYTYIFIHTSTLLSEQGQFAIITSNSWLDVSYGSVLKEFFLDNFKIKAIIGSWAEPWFDDAAVNTVITILEKESNERLREKNIVKFVKLKKKFSELLPFQDLKLESTKRWQLIDKLVDLIETAEYHSGLKSITEEISSLDISDMRIRMIKQSCLKTEILSKGEQAKWGQYLRAPDVYFELLEKLKNSLTSLNTIADIRRGYTTGINEFFYLEEIPGKGMEDCSYCKNSRGWEGYIESSFLKTVIKSPKESEAITITPTSLKYKIFLCNQSKNELRKNGNKFALKYIEWGEKQRTKENILWPEVSSVNNRTYWYGIPAKEPGPILLQMINNDRFLSFENKVKVQVDHNLFEWLIDEKYHDTAIKYLNSSLFGLIREINSRVNLGDGATKTEGVDWNNLMLAPKDDLSIKISTKAMFTRKILPIWQEIKQKDRNELDCKVLESLGLDPEYYLPKIYDGLCEVVKERLGLPKMRKKKQKSDEKIAYDKIKIDVIEDCIPQGVKVFPNDFYIDGDFHQLECDSYSTIGKPLVIDSFFNLFQLKTEDGKVIIELDIESKAEYAMLLSQRKNYQIRIPKNEAIVEEILKNYHQYTSELLELLTVNAKEKLHDWAIAERMAKEIMSDYGL